MRHRGTAVAAVLIAVLSAVPGAAAVPVLGAMLGVDPPRGVVPATVTVAGSCPREEDPDGSFFPTETSLSVAGLDTVTVALDDFGMFVGFDVDLPADMPAGDVPFTTECGGETSFTVLAAPTLELVPESARAGADVVATGTCPRGSRPPAVLLEDRTLVTAPLDAVTGEFGPATFTVPDDAGLGPQVVETSCGGRAVLTVLPPPTSPPTVPPTVPPGTTLVLVPDLTGLTEAEAIAALGDQLVLANPTGGDGRVTSQDPPALARVRPGTAVAIVLEAAAVEPVSAWTPVELGGIGLVVLLALFAAAMIARSVHRRRRERRWLSERVAVLAAASYLQLSEAPRGQVPGLDVELAVRRDAPRLQEVGDGRR